jgi:trehalose 6-phosphate synthase
MQNSNNYCRDIQENILSRRNLVIVSNRGPYSFQLDEKGEYDMKRSRGGLVTALLGLANQVDSTWISCAMNEHDRSWHKGTVPAGGNDTSLQLHFICPDQDAYQRYYQVIANPLLWFLQHSMWDFAYAPSFNRETWDAWDEGYCLVNSLFAEAVYEQVVNNPGQTIVMFQDYHLYLAARHLRKKVRKEKEPIITHFIHIPWPGPEDWGLLPGKMRRQVLDGLCAVDLLGFQNREDALNFLRTCESLLPDARVNYRKGWVELHHQVTHVRDFPISIDVKALEEESRTDEVRQFNQQLKEQFGDRKLIVRIDRVEPSKNIVRGFQAFDELLEVYPQFRGKVQFLALLVPSRLEVEEYQGYLNELMAAAGSVNAKYGSPDWEPVRVLVGESYPRAVAAMQLYDVLLVNPVADGMNLVAKEGPIVNKKNGVVILSERAGAHQQLGPNSLVISPLDVSATADALRLALTMPLPERRERASNLRKEIEREDIYSWLCWQLDTLQEIDQIVDEEVFESSS